MIFVTFVPERSAAAVSAADSAPGSQPGFHEDQDRPEATGIADLAAGDAGAQEAYAIGIPAAEGAAQAAPLGFICPGAGSGTGHRHLLAAIVSRYIVPTPTNVTYFETPELFRRWLKANHLKAAELWVGFYKRGSGQASITWPESVDEALCAGWIDGIRKSLDADRYVIRFSPRKSTSIWSAVNIKRMHVLIEERRVLVAGEKAFAARRENKSGIYAYEQRRAQLEEPYASILKKQKKAWAFFEAQPPGYRKIMGWFVVSAKREETRMARLKALIDACEKGKRLR
jgi:uncharacterized protein YdeI (YjbR/CyaY-like superfamily)